MNRSIVYLAILALTVPAAAQRRNASGTEVWKFLAGKYDKNKDGKITPAEHARGEQKFAGYDRNDDGVITAADFAGGGGRRRGNRSRGGRRAPTDRSIVGPAIAEALANNADTDGNGKVTPVEWDKTLSALDANQDAIIDAEELGGIMCAALGRKNLSKRAIERRSRHLDTNKDGKVQRAELAAMFGKMDANKDAVLVAAEIGAARARPVGRVQPKVGDVAPDFELPLVKDRETLVKLSSFRGRKPVALIFGSYT